MRHALTVAAFLVLLAGTGACAEYPGAVFLMIFPDARTTALGGCGTALGDLDANTYYNPACLATASRLAASWTHVNWLGGLCQGVSYDHAGVAYRLGERLGFAANVVYMQTGETDVIDYSGNLVGRYRPFDVAPSVSAACRILPYLSVGVTAKAIYSFLYPKWAVRWSPEMPLLDGGDALTFAGDVGVQYRPHSYLQLGLALNNLGPDIRYGKYDNNPLPAILRFGFALKPRIPGPVEVALVGDLWRDLVTPIEYWGDGDSALMLWENMQDGLGLELRVAKLASVRLGYFENIQSYSGGITVKDQHGITRRVSLLRFVTQTGLGKAVGMGLCWGVGLEYRGLKLDVGVDEEIYYIAPRNVRFQLSARL